jgi:hypothetical protein
MIADKSYEAMFAVRKRGKPNQNNQNLQRLCHHTCIILLLDFQSLFQQVLRLADLFSFGSFTIFFFLSSVFLEVTDYSDLQAEKNKN